MMGAKVSLVNRDTVDVDGRNVHLSDDIFDLTKDTARPIIHGSMLGRFAGPRPRCRAAATSGSAPSITHQGHEGARRSMTISGGFIAPRKGRALAGPRIYLDKVSVGATINVMIAATMAKGMTVMRTSRVCRHVDLANFLNSMGAESEAPVGRPQDPRGGAAPRRDLYAHPRQDRGGTYMAAGRSTAARSPLKRDPPHLECSAQAARDGAGDRGGRR
jgi:UDP-N-acetylglucosamine 1-carboxyvinyltransferase